MNKIQITISQLPIWIIWIILSPICGVSEDRLIMPTEPVHMAQEYYEKGEFRIAAEYYQKNLKLCQSQKEIEACMTWVIRLANCYSEMGLHEEVIALLKNYLPELSKISSHANRAMVYHALADSYLYLGKLKEAASNLEIGAKEANESKDVLIQAAVLNTIGKLFYSLKHLNSAIEAFDHAVSLLQIHGIENALYVGVLINRFRVKLDETTIHTPEIVSEIKKILDIIYRLPDTYEKATLSLTFGSICLDLLKKNRHPDGSQDILSITLKVFETAKQIGLKLDNFEILSAVNGYLGSLYELKQRFEEAIQLTRQAIFYAQGSDSKPNLYRWYWQLGRLYSVLNDIPSAIFAYQTSIEILTPICQHMSQHFRATRNIFDEDIKPVYLGLIEILIREAASTTNQEIKKNNLLKARNTIERLNTAELQDFFRDECVAYRHDQASTSRNTDSEIVVIYPILLPDHPVMLMDFEDGLHAIPLDVKTSDLTATVKQFRRRIQEWDDTSNIYRDSNQIYQWLIRPIESELAVRNIHTIIIAPDGALRLIPFSALLNLNRFLVEQFAIATIPAWSLTQRDSLRVKSYTALTAGISDEKKEGKWTFSPLKKVPEELNYISELFQGQQLLNKNFSTDNLTQVYRTHPYTIIHLATHGVFGGSSDETFLLTYHEKLTMNVLEKLIDIGRYRKEPVELLTLNGCQTGIGDERSAFGLAGIAVKAGVKSALATLWPVDDNASFKLITEFYQQLNQGVSKAKALQLAQQKMIKTPQFWHPAFWAGYLLIGNWK